MKITIDVLVDGTDIPVPESFKEKIAKHIASAVTIKTNIRHNDLHHEIKAYTCAILPQSFDITAGR